MQEVLKQLVELQKMDSRIVALESVIKNTPQHFAEIKQRLDKVILGYDTIKLEAESNKKAYLSLQAELEDHKAQLANSQKKSEAVHNQREYKSVLAEEEKLNKMIDSKQAELKELQNKDYQFESDLSQAEEQKDKLEKELAAMYASKKDEDKQFSDELEALLVKRSDFAAKIKKSTLMKYDRVREHSKNNIGIASVKDEVCNGCYMHIPPQLYVEVKKDDAIKVCPHCRRILYYIPAKKEEEGK